MLHKCIQLEVIVAQKRWQKLCTYARLKRSLTWQICRCSSDQNTAPRVHYFTPRSEDGAATDVFSIGRSALAMWRIDPNAPATAQPVSPSNDKSAKMIW